MIKYFLTLLCLSSALAAIPVCLKADVLQIPEVMKKHADTPAPDKGMNKEQVEEEFGPPYLQSPVVGDPPISYWKYKAFTVYFEQNHVIHTVVHHTPRQS